MRINILEYIGKSSPFPDDSYELQWELVLDNNLIQSPFCNQKSYYNQDGFDSVSWTETINLYQNDIKTLNINVRRNSKIDRILSVEFDQVNSLSYSLIQWTLGYNLIVGLSIETKDNEIIEVLTNGEILRRN